MQPDSCPDETLWRQFLDESLPESETRRLENHLESCTQCPLTLQHVAAGDETWEGTAAKLAEADNRPEAALPSGHLQMAMDELKERSGPGAAEWTVSPESLTFLRAADNDDLIGHIGPYDVLGIIGHGGMGIVLKAWDTSLRRVVAIKVLAGHLASSAAARRRFVREAQAAAAVTHDHVVAIHAVEESFEPPYLVMQFIEGKTVQQRLDQTGPLDVCEILRIGQQTAQGLAAAHRQGIVHRDIKPANILLENGVERVRITDFGLARAIDDASMTQSGVVAGTPLFMAPEQAQGKPVDNRADLFSLGSVLYALCTGRPPFRSSTMMGVIRRVCDDEARPIREINPDIPEWLCAIIERLLRKNPDERYDSADHVAELLGDCLAHLQHPLNAPLPVELRASHRSSDVGASTTDVSNPATERAPTAPMTGSQDVVSMGDDNTDTIRKHAKAILKTPLRLTIFVAVLNAMFHLSMALYFSMAAELQPFSGNSVVAVFVVLFLAMVLAILGALRAMRLTSLGWGMTSAVLLILIGPAYPLGWPAGIWLLWSLGRADVRVAFRQDADRYRNLPGPESLKTPERTLARIGSIVAIVLLSAAFPGLLYWIAQGGLPAVEIEARIGIFVSVGLAIMLLGTAFRFGFGVGSRVANEKELAAWRAHVSSPANWIGTTVSMAACLVMWMDYSGPFYEPFIESAVLPICLLAIITLIIIAVVRRVRKSQQTEAEQNSQGDQRVSTFQWPVGCLAILIPAMLLWNQWHQRLGYVWFNSDSPDLLVQFHESGQLQPMTRYGSVTKFRLPPGRYKWTVSEPGLIGDSVAAGLITVESRGTETIDVNLLGRPAQEKLLRRWKCRSYFIDWSAGDSAVGSSAETMHGATSLKSSLEEWTRRPSWASFHNGYAIFHYSDEPRQLRFTCETQDAQSPKTIALTQQQLTMDHEHNSIAGIWAIGKKSLVLHLAPEGDHRGLTFGRTAPPRRLVRLTFEPPDDLTNLQGDWHVVSAESNGSPVASTHIAGNRMRVEGDSMEHYSLADRAAEYQQPNHCLLDLESCRIDLETDAAPRRFTLRLSNGKDPIRFGLYRLTADENGAHLLISMSRSGYPSRLESTGSGAGDIAVFRRGRDEATEQPVGEAEATEAENSSSNAAVPTSEQ